MVQESAKEKKAKKQTSSGKKKSGRTKIEHSHLEFDPESVPKRRKK